MDVNPRYNLYFAEKRPFFLEGRAHYAIGAFGASERDPLRSIVHTRTIVDLIAGVRLSAKIGEKDMLATMFVVDELSSVNAGDAEYANVPILRYKRALHDDSYVGGIYAARQFTGLLRPKFYPSESFVQRIDAEMFTAQTRDAFYDMWETFNHISFLSYFLDRLYFKVKYSYSTGKQ